MAGWSHQCQRDAAGRVERYALHRDGEPVTRAQALELLVADAGFRDCLNDLLDASDFVAYRWETPSLTHRSAGQPFEFVLADDPYLDRAAPEPDVFALLP